MGTTNISRTAPAYGVKEHAPVTGVVLRILKHSLEEQRESFDIKIEISNLLDSKLEI